MRLTSEVERWIIPAIDVPTFSEARRLIMTLAPHCGPFKIGMEQITATCFNPDAGNPFRLVLGLGGSIMFDDKFNDIPRTVVAASQAAAAGAAIITVNTEAGPEALEKTVLAVRQTVEGLGIPMPVLAGITVLTSRNSEDLWRSGYFRRYAATREQVREMPKKIQERWIAELVDLRADLAMECGLNGLVCGTNQVARLHQRYGDDPSYIVPGSRGPEASHDDQKMVGSEVEAILGGATWLVKGDELKNAADPDAALHAIANRIRVGLGIAAE